MHAANLRARETVSTPYKLPRNLSNNGIPYTRLRSFSLECGGQVKILQMRTLANT